jgi:regulator of penicillin binding proteins and beta lactamase transcription (morphogene)
MYSKKLGSLFMSKQQELLERIQAEFQPHFATVENESHMHSSGRGADSHFKLVIVSDAFEGMRKVQRHQKLYQLFADDLKNGIHALALHLYTKSEWESLGKAFPKSPNCLGVGQ